MTGLAFLFVGGPENGPESAGAVIAKGGEEGVTSGIGHQLIIGGKSPNHVQLLFPQLGRPPQALARTANLTNTLKLTKVIGEAKELLDLGLAGALAVDCGLGVI